MFVFVRWEQHRATIFQREELWKEFDITHLSQIAGNEIPTWRPPFFWRKPEYLRNNKVCNPVTWCLENNFPKTPKTWKQPPPPIPKISWRQERAFRSESVRLSFHNFHLAGCWTVTYLRIKNYCNMIMSIMLHEIKLPEHIKHYNWLLHVVAKSLFIWLQQRPLAYRHSLEHAQFIFTYHILRFCCWQWNLRDDQFCIQAILVQYLS